MCVLVNKVSKLVFYTQSTGTVISGRVCKQRLKAFYFFDVIKFTSVHCILCQPVCNKHWSARK